MRRNRCMRHEAEQGCGSERQRHAVTSDTFHIESYLCIHASMATDGIDIGMGKIRSVGDMDRRQHTPRTGRRHQRRPCRGIHPCGTGRHPRPRWGRTGAYACRAARRRRPPSLTRLPRYSRRSARGARRRRGLPLVCHVAAGLAPGARGAWLVWPEGHACRSCGQIGGDDGAGRRELWGGQGCGVAVVCDLGDVGRRYEAVWSLVRRERSADRCVKAVWVCRGGRPASAVKASRDLAGRCRIAWSA